MQVANRFWGWGFLVSVAFTPGLMSAAIVGRWAVIGLGVPLVAELRLKAPLIVQAAVAAGVAWSAASLIATPDTMDGLLFLFFMVVLVGAMGAASQAASLTPLLSGMCWGLLVSGGFCLAKAAGYPLVAENNAGGYAGLFYNAEVLVELAAPLVVWAAAKRKWHLAAIGLLPIVMNQSRLAFLVVIFGLAVVYWPRAWRWRVITALGALALAAAVVGYLTIYGGKFGGGALRLAMWYGTALAITPAGRGLGWYRSTHMTEEFGHSDFLQALAELGIGALFFAVIIVYALRNRRDIAEKAAFVAICAEMALSFPLHVPASAFLIAVLAGYLVRDCGDVHVLQSNGRVDDDSDAQRRPSSWRGNSIDRGSRGSVVSVRLPSPALSQLGTA